MPSMAGTLTPKTITVLEAIARGFTYEQILSAHPDLTYLDIFSAAREALDSLPICPSDTDTPARKITKTLADYRKTDPRAYEKWTEEEEDALIQLMEKGHTIQSAAELLQRKPSAIESRLEKLKS